jgi:hypothetical protein
LDLAEEHMVLENGDQQPRVLRVEGLTLSFPEWSKSELQDAQYQDEDIGPIARWVKEGKRPSWSDVTPCSPATKSYWAQWNSLCKKNGLVFRLTSR